VDARKKTPLRSASRTRRHKCKENEKSKQKKENVVLRLLMLLMLLTQIMLLLKKSPAADPNAAYPAGGAQG